MGGTYSAGMAMVVVLLGLLALRVPIAFGLAASGIVGLMIERPWRAIEFLLSNVAYANSAEFGFVVMPLFLFMGHMAFSAGLSARAYEAGQKLLGRVHGGLAIATVFACAAFGTICGSSVATAATFARVALPEMLEKGYKESLATGCVASGGTLGALIPPSGILILYAIVTQVPISKLFLAAFIPGILTAVVYIIGILIMVKWKPHLAGPKPTERYTVREKARAVVNMWEVILLFLLVMGSIYTGLATPTEAAAVGALLSLVAVLRRPKPMAHVKEGLMQTGATTSSIFALIIGAGLFSLALTTTQAAQELVQYITSLKLSPTQLLLLLLIPYFVLGCFLDGVSLLLITVPIAFPIVQAAGIHPVLFGLLVCKLIEIGCLTPPVGLNVLVVKASHPGISLRDAFVGCAPFLLMEIVIVGLMIAFPQLSLFLIE
ncbi:TRAP transporter large permease [Ramlibacter sp.]|uniref:TRAP transporter large permease n=1 Tax=Ramlibacter sp. TaxID=1917967 RepID=UPI003D111962